LLRPYSSKRADAAKWVSIHYYQALLAAVTSHDTRFDPPRAQPRGTQTRYHVVRRPAFGVKGSDLLDSQGTTTSRHSRCVRRTGCTAGAADNGHDCQRIKIFDRHRALQLFSSPFSL